MCYAAAKATASGPFATASANARAVATCAASPPVASGLFCALLCCAVLFCAALRPVHGVTTGAERLPSTVLNSMLALCQHCAVYYIEAQQLALHLGHYDCNTFIFGIQLYFHLLHSAILSSFAFSCHTILLAAAAYCVKLIVPPCLPVLLWAGFMHCIHCCIACAGNFEVQTCLL